MISALFWFVMVLVSTKIIVLWLFALASWTHDNSRWSVPWMSKRWNSNKRLKQQSVESANSEPIKMSVEQVFQFLLCTCSIVSLPVAMYFQFDFKWGSNIWITLRAFPRTCSMFKPHFADKKFRSYCNTFLQTRSSETKRRIQVMVWTSLDVSLFTFLSCRGWFRAPPSLS